MRLMKITALTGSWLRCARDVALAMMAVAGVSCAVIAQTVLLPPAPGLAAGSVDTAQPDRGINEWLLRMHEASRRRAYIGTFVVSSGSSMASAKIWHICANRWDCFRISCNQLTRQSPSFTVPAWQGMTAWQDLMPIWCCCSPKTSCAMAIGSGAKKRLVWL